MSEILLSIGTVILFSAFSVLMFIGVKRSAWSKSQMKGFTDEFDDKELKLVGLFVLLVVVGISCYVIVLFFL